MCSLAGEASIMLQSKNPGARSYKPITKKKVLILLKRLRGLTHAHASFVDRHKFLQ